MVPNGSSAKNLKGFTLIEVLISVALLIFIFSLGPFFNVSILREYQISQEADYLEDNLRLIQALSLFGKDDASFGIQFSSDKYSLFEKISGKIELFRSHLLPKGIIISGPEEIVFEKPSGKPSWSGILRIMEMENGVVFRKKEVEINSQGNIEILK